MRDSPTTVMSLAARSRTSMFRITGETIKRRGDLAFSIQRLPRIPGARRSITVLAVLTHRCQMQGHGFHHTQFIRTTDLLTWARSTIARPERHSADDAMGQRALKCGDDPLTGANVWRGYESSATGTKHCYFKGQWCKYCFGW